MRVASYELLFKKIKLRVASYELHDKKIKVRVASCKVHFNPTYYRPFGATSDIGGGGTIYPPY